MLHSQITKLLPVPSHLLLGCRWSGNVAIAKYSLSPWTRLKPAFLPMGWEREGLTAAGRESRHARRCRELAAKQREIAGADRGSCSIQSRLSMSKTKGKEREAKERVSR